MPGLESNLEILISCCFYWLLCLLIAMTSARTLNKLVSVLGRNETKRVFLKTNHDNYPSVAIQ
jgi:hypothetical protein